MTIPVRLPGRRNLALKLCYVGVRYHGWQIQKSVPSVGQAIQDALSRLCGHAVTLHGCGRTDAGVHAEWYVANFRTNSSIPACRVSCAVNALLPSDIAVLDCQEVPECFHAINDCVKKQYTYRLHCAAQRSPFMSRAYHYPFPVDMKAVCAACSVFVGRHDFSAFQTAGSPTKSTIRTVSLCECTGEVETFSRESVVEVRVAADGFLYNMVRTIVGTVLYVSEGKLSVEDVSALLCGGTRADAGPTAPACGLSMSRVWYPERFGLW